MRMNGARSEQLMTPHSLIFIPTLLPGILLRVDKIPSQSRVPYTHFSHPSRMDILEGVVQALGVVRGILMSHMSAAPDLQPTRPGRPAMWEGEGGNTQCIFIHGFNHVLPCSWQANALLWVASTSASR